MERAKSKDPSLFEGKTTTLVNHVDSITTRYKDSIVFKEKVTITGKTLIVCDSAKKAKPFDQTVTTGLVKVHFWTDSSGVFHYEVDQDSVKSRFSTYEQQLKSARDSTVNNYIPVPSVVYKTSWKSLLISGGVGTAIGFVLLGLLRSSFLGKAFTFITSTISRVFKR